MAILITRLPALVLRAREDEDLAKHVMAITKESRDQSAEVTRGIQARGSTFLTLLVGIVPLAMVGIAFGAPSQDTSLAGWVGFAMVVLAVVLLLLAAIAAALASGFGRTASVNLDFLEQAGEEKSLARLFADEAETWHHAAVLNMETGQRRARDLFYAGRVAVLALLTGLVGLVVLFATGGWDPNETEADERDAPTAAVECLAGDRDGRWSLEA